MTKQIEINIFAWCLEFNASMEITSCPSSNAPFDTPAVSHLR